MNQKKRKTPFQKIYQLILEKRVLPDNFSSLLPQRWKRVGSIGIIELRSELLPWKHEIGEIYLSFLPELTTLALKVGTASNTERLPNFEILAGEKNPITLHKELGCKFWIDAIKLTFSNGNHAERQRMITLSQRNEHIIDMFSCVGNLSLPVAVHNKTAKIIGIEINPYAYEFLIKNVQENKVNNRYQTILGDNRKHTPKNWANRVIMGYFTIDEQQFTAALASLRQSKGGMIHAHGLSSSRKPEDWLEKIETIIKKSFPGFIIDSSEKIVIKTVAAGIEHFVNDIKIKCS
ncbi:MAG: class I SAM-dependent methyltransferase family protein [Candidatus Hodarchaeota archaeon]